MQRLHRYLIASAGSKSPRTEKPYCVTAMGLLIGLNWRIKSALIEVVPASTLRAFHPSAWLVIARDAMIKGISPTATIISAAVEASARRSSMARL